MFQDGTQALRELLQIGVKPVVTETEKQKEKEQVKSTEPSVHSSSGGGSGARHLSVDELFRSQSEFKSWLSKLKTSVLCFELSF